MKKIARLMLALLCISNAVMAQSNVSFGSPYSTVDAPYNDYLYNGNEILSIKAESKKLVLQKLNSSTLSEISTKSFEDFPKGYKVEYTARTGDAYYLFYSLSDKASVKLFAREIDFTQGAFIGEAKQLLNLDGKLSKHSSLGFRSSYDQSNLLVYYSLATDNKKANERGVQVFNQKLESVWNKQSKQSTEVQSVDYAVDAKGTVYTLTQKNASVELTIASASAEPSTKAVTLDKKSIRKIGLFETSADEILCAGLYNKDINTSAAGGLFILKANNLNDAVTCPISPNVMNQYNADQQSSAQFVLKEVILEKDGGLTLIGESQRLETIRYYTPKGHARNAYVLHYDDILITKIDPIGNLSWMKKLPKRQTGKASEGQGQMSYRYMASENNYYLIFLDNEKNKNIAQDEAPANYVNGEVGSLTAYEITKDQGLVSKLSILDTSDNKQLKVNNFSTHKIVPLDEASFVLEFSKKGNEDVLMKTVFSQ
ncbi:MAG: hypothetical protein K0R51_2865 [Cytophagaceae bacterium]|jgi:hypothetical protein|nr:hypothetical protein [Cytophagaceae bacterium]